MNKQQVVRTLMRSRPFKMLAKNTSSKRASRVARMVAELPGEAAWLVVQGPSPLKGDLLMLEGFVPDYKNVIQHAAYMQGRGLTQLMGTQVHQSYISRKLCTFKKLPHISMMDQKYQRLT